MYITLVWAGAFRSWESWEALTRVRNFVKYSASYYGDLGRLAPEAVYIRPIAGRAVAGGELVGGIQCRRRSYPYTQASPASFALDLRRNWVPASLRKPRDIPPGQSLFAGLLIGASCSVALERFPPALSLAHLASSVKNGSATLQLMRAPAQAPRRWSWPAHRPPTEYERQCWPPRQIQLADRKVNGRP